jgi:hypothetical protein
MTTHRMTYTRAVAVMIGLCCALVWHSAAHAQVRDERAVKAAFVYNLTRYVEWPQARKELLIGVIGDPQTGQVLKSVLEGKMSDSATIRVLLAPSDNELDQVAVLYVAGSSPNVIEEALRRARNKSALTIGETETFARAGGMVALVTVEDHVHIFVNLQASEAKDLKISSRLLNLASIVKPAAGGRTP